MGNVIFGGGRITMVPGTLMAGSGWMGITTAWQSAITSMGMVTCWPIQRLPTDTR